jgi:hypothetical protein
MEIISMRVSKIVFGSIFFLSKPFFLCEMGFQVCFCLARRPSIINNFLYQEFNGHNGVIWVISDEFCTVCREKQ